MKRIHNSLSRAQQFQLLEFITDDQQLVQMDGMSIGQAREYCSNELEFTITSGNITGARKTAGELGRAVWVLATGPIDLVNIVKRLGGRVDELEGRMDKWEA